VAALPAGDPLRDSAIAGLTAQLGQWMLIAGIAIALVAPVLGQRADASGRRKTWLGVANLLLVLIMFALFFVRAEPRFFALGAALMAFGSVIDTVANVNYNALIGSVSTPKTVGRVSGLGWGFGYLGGIVALLLVVVFQMSNWFGLETAAGLPFRLIAVGAAIWAIVFGWPLYRYVPELPVGEGRRKVGWGESYVLLFRQVKYLFRTSRSTFWFLIASAIYRDGLSGIFTFGAVIAAVSFNFSAQEVLIFGLVANLVAGVSTILVGRLDDFWGARKVIIVSLVLLLVSGAVALGLHGFGSIIFWIFGLVLCATVGPAQAASRSYLARVAPAGHESETFGLYATAGKAASWMSAGLWTIFITIFGATIWGLLGILIVIVVGLLALIFLVHPPVNDLATAEPILPN
jgi:UMF1 family MFS transporter